MLIWTFLISNLSKIGIGITGILGFFLYGKNSKLTRENKELQQSLESSNRVVEIQNKVINVTQNTKPTDFDGNLQRMRDGKL